MQEPTDRDAGRVATADASIQPELVGDPSELPPWLIFGQREVASEVAGSARVAAPPADTPTTTTPAAGAVDEPVVPRPPSAFDPSAPAPSHAAVLPLAAHETTAPVRVAVTVTPDITTHGADQPAARDVDGSGFAVVVVDDGYSPYYDLDNVLGGLDFADRDSNALQATLASHGSWVADVVTDIASGVDVIHLKVFADNDGAASFWDVEAALRWVADNQDFYDIAAVNMSIGFGNVTTPTTTMLSDEIAELTNDGVLVVAAAGNAGDVYDDGVSVLAADPNVVAVSAVADDGNLASFSQHSATLTDLAAPGVGVAIDTVFGYDVIVNGTSFAAPQVSGLAALLQDAATDVIGRRLSPVELVEIMQATGTHVAGEAEADFRAIDAAAALAFLGEHGEDLNGLATEQLIT